MNATYAPDVELARRCAAGDEQAWERFILDYRPILYRAADALDPSGGARDLADSLYADLYGMPDSSGERRSLLRYYQGRSSLATWLRAVLSQRYVDRLREQKRLEPLPDDGKPIESARFSSEPADPERSRHLSMLRDALSRAVDALAPRDRLRLSFYYLRELTLAEIGRLLKEHEATVSRQLARTRRAVRDDVERQLRDVSKLADAQIAECFSAAADDAGPLDLSQLLGSDEPRKKSAQDRSI